jgi:hypothetical protein
MPPSIISESWEDDVEKRKQFASDIIAVLYTWPTFAKAKAVYPNLSNEDIEEVEASAYFISYRAICFGTMTAVEGIDHIDDMKDNNWKGCYWFLWGTIKNLALTQLKNFRIHPMISIEVLAKPLEIQDASIPSFSVFARRAIEISKNVLSVELNQLIRLRRRGLTFAQIAEKLGNEHDRNWVSNRLSQSYATIATIFVHSLDLDFIEQIRNEIKIVEEGKKKVSEGLNWELIYDSQVEPTSYHEEALSDIDVVSNFIERIVNYGARQKIARAEEQRKRGGVSREVEQ